MNNYHLNNCKIKTNFCFTPPVFESDNLHFIWNARWYFQDTSIKYAAAHKSLANVYGELNGNKSARNVLQLREWFAPSMKTGFEDKINPSHAALLYMKMKYIWIFYHFWTLRRCRLFIPYRCLSHAVNTMALMRCLIASPGHQQLRYRLNCPGIFLPHC